MFGGLLYVIKLQSESSKRLSIAVEKLSNSIAYCPTNKENKDRIKGPSGFPL